MGSNGNLNLWQDNTAFWRKKLTIAKAKKNSWNQFFSNWFCKNAAFTKFLSKKCHSDYYTWFDVKYISRIFAEFCCVLHFHAKRNLQKWKVKCLKYLLHLNKIVAFWRKNTFHSSKIVSHFRCTNSCLRRTKFQIRCYIRKNTTKRYNTPENCPRGAQNNTVWLTQDLPPWSITFLLLTTWNAIQG